jgi:lipoate-protein ligase A
LDAATATSRRPAVEVLLGDAPEARRGIAEDFALLDRARTDSRVWTCMQPAVVLGISRDPDVEVDAEECRRLGFALLRRASGGGTVAIGRGTIQYAIVLAHDGAEPPSITAAKHHCNAVLREALAHAGVEADLHADASGDLRLGDRKAGGLALRRHRDATLVHGTLLTVADLAVISAVLRHPASEPAWRRGRSHDEFLAGLGDLDAGAFARALRQSLARGAARGPAA